jgi:hypothetical protein
MAAPRQMPIEQSKWQGIARDQLQISEVALQIRNARDAAHHVDRQLAG